MDVYRYQSRSVANLNRDTRSAFVRMNYHQMKAIQTQINYLYDKFLNKQQELYSPLRQRIKIKSDNKL